MNNSNKNLIYDTEKWKINKIEIQNKNFYEIEWFDYFNDIFIVNFKTNKLIHIYKKIMEFESLIDKSCLWAIYRSQKNNYTVLCLSDMLDLANKNMHLQQANYDWKKIMETNKNNLKITFQNFAVSLNLDLKPICFFGNINSINSECLNFFLLHKYFQENLDNNNINEFTIETKLYKFPEYSNEFNLKTTSKSYIKSLGIFFSIILILLISLNLISEEYKKFLYFFALVGSVYIIWVLAYPTIYEIYLNHSLTNKLLKNFESDQENNLEKTLQKLNYFKSDIPKEIKNSINGLNDLYWYTNKNQGREEAEYTYKNCLKRVLCNLSIF